MKNAMLGSFVGATLLFGVLLAGCGGNNDKCKGTTCLAGQTCNPSTGLCEATGGGAGGGSGGGSVGGGTGGGSGGGTGGGSVGGGTGGGSGGGTGGGSGGGTGGGTGGGDGGTVPANDTCAGVEDLTFTNNTVTVTPDLTAATDDYQGTCSSSAGPDVVYHLHLTQDQSVTLDEVGANVDGVLYLGDSPCQSTGAGNYTPHGAVCSDNGLSKGDPEHLFVPDLPAGDYFVFVDSYSSTSTGPVTLTVTLGAPVPPPANDKCSGAIDLTFTNDVAAATVDLTAANDDYHGSCSAANGPDAVFHFNLTAPRLVTVSETGAMVDAVVYLGNSPCEAADGGYTIRNGACANSSTMQGTAESFTLPYVPAGDYYVFVDSSSSTSTGNADLTVTLGTAIPPPANDTCNTATGLFADGGASDVLTGTTVSANDDFGGDCFPTASTTGADVFYSFSFTGANRKFAADVTTDGGLRSELYVVAASACQSGTIAAGTPELACTFAAGIRGDNRLVVDSLPAGSYLLGVDSHQDESGNATMGSFRLAATLSAASTPQTNVACNMATPITLGNGPYPATSRAGSTTGTTAGGGDHHEVTCDIGNGPDSPAGYDVAYSFTAPALGDGGVVVRAMVTSTNFEVLNPVVFVESTCNSDAGMGCGEGYNQTSYFTPATAVGYLRTSSGAALTVWADSLDADAGGPFNLDVDVASAPANDQCAGGIALTANTSVSGTTLGATNDYDSAGVVTGGNCTDSLLGAEVVYTYTPAATGMATVTIWPQRGFDAALAVLSACTATSCLESADVNYPSDPETVTFMATMGTTYYILADGFTDDLTDPSARGGFTIGVSQ